MAVVFLAEDLKHHRRVALKVLKPERAHAIGTERFLREIETAAQLSHPNILPLHDSGEADGLLYFVMPYVEGETLRERIERERRFSVEEAVRITSEVAGALHYAHSQGLIHRDIKPENILFQAGHAVVSDFGISRAMTEAGGGRLTQTGVAMGTMAYMSPEQASGAAELDCRSDLYSLGCVLFEMLAGEVPYEGPTPQAVLAKKLVEPLPSLESLGASAPPTVGGVLTKALANEAADRFESSEEFRQTLTRAVTTVAIEEDARRRRRARRIQTAAIGVAVISMAGAGGWLSKTLSGPAIERLAVLPVATPLNTPEQEHLVHGMFNGLITELGQAGIRVIGSVQSMMQYQNTEMTVREIAQELGVDAVLQSSVFWVGDSVGITANLVDGLSEEYLWSQSYSEASQNVLALYRQVTRAIAGEIHLALTPQAEARLATTRPVNPQAHEAYLQGRFHASRLTQVDLETAIQYYEQALDFDSAYAPAHAGISWAWIALQQVGYLRPEEAVPQARAAALRAMELDSTQAAVRHTLGTVRWSEWDWEAAEAAYRRAIEINPGYGDARADYSHLLLVLKRWEEAIAQVDTALSYDPFNVKFQAFRGVVLLNSLRTEEGIAQLEEVLRVWPNHPIALIVLPEASHVLGRHDEAVDQLVELYTVLGDQEVADVLRRGYAGGDYPEAMRGAAEILEARAASSFVPPTFVMRLYAMAGDREKTLEWLERGYAAHEPDAPYMGGNQILEFVSGEPRFQQLLRRLNLPG
jgi:serine/threonine-protein kinase